MEGHTNFYLQSKQVNGQNIEYRKCSSCSAVTIEGQEPFFNLSCAVASQQKQAYLESIKKQL